MESIRISGQEKMFEIIKQWEQSNLSKKAFCAQHKVANDTFHYWHKKYKVKDAKDLAPFIPVQMKAVNSGRQPFAEVTLPDGQKLIFYNFVEASFLKSLLS